MIPRNLLHSAQMAYAILRANLTRVPRIISIQIMLNYTCNLRCSYCSAPQSDEVMEFDKIKNILSFLGEMGVLEVSFAGGEPTIHPDYEEIIRLSRKLGFFVTVSTNGSVPISNADDGATPHLISVSLDGPSDVHDLYRGKGTWERANATLNYLKDRDVSLAINTVIGRHNCDLKIIEWLLAKAEQVNASFNFQLMLPRFDSKGEENPLAPDMEQIKSLIQGILNMPSSKKRCLIFGDEILKTFMTWESLVPYYRTREGKVCFAGRNFAYISASGILAPCSLLEDHPWYKTNDLFKVGFEQAFKTIQKIPCNDCYLGCNVLRNNIQNLNLRTLKGALRMVLTKR